MCKEKIFYPAIHSVSNVFLDKAELQPVGNLADANATIAQLTGALAESQNNLERSQDVVKELVDIVVKAHITICSSCGQAPYCANSSDEYCENYIEYQQALANAKEMMG